VPGPLKERRVVRRTDWFRVLADLHSAGVPNSTVADYLQIPQGTVRGWKSGSEPRHHDGEQLLEVWILVTGKARTDRPTRVG
jgi:hypothetical protein